MDVVQGSNAALSENDANSVEGRSSPGAKRRGAVTRALIGDLMQFADFLLVIATSVGVAMVYHSFALQAEFDFQYYAAAGIIGATGLTALLRRDGYYEFDALIFSTGTLRAIVSRWALVVQGLIAFGFALKISANFSRVWLISWSVSTTVVILSVRFLFAPILKSMSSAGGVFARRIAIVGTGDVARSVAKMIEESEKGLSVFGFYEPDLASLDTPDKSMTGTSLSDLTQAARNGEVDDVIFADPSVPNNTMNRLVRRLSILPVSISICPNPHWLDHTGGAVTGLGGVNVLSLYRRPLEGWGGIFKTIEDYVLGALIFIALSPVLLVIALLIKFQDKGPILFAQQRHGFNNAVFRIYKFRTMTVTEDGDEIKQAQLDDPRITPLGKILRRYSLDELPQLINVLKGEMSLVGPRPHALAHNHQYARTIENYSGRHKVKPGITGWAQVNGYRGETSENEMMEQRVKFDLSYVDNWSLWFDFKILVMTVNAVVFPKNAV